MKVSVNGEIREQKDALISIADKAVWYDFGVYENIKVLQGKVMWPLPHVDRLFRSAQLIGLTLGEDKETVLSWIAAYARDAQLQNHIIKVCAYGDADTNTRATLSLFAVGLTFYPDSYYSKGVSAITYPGERHFPNAKSMDTLLSFMAFREAARQGAFDSFLVDGDGNVREGSRSNIYIIAHDMVITPPKEEVLEGVTRTLVFELLQHHDIPFQEAPLSKERLMAAQEVFITATSANVMPVVSVDGATIGNGAVGPVTKRIYQLYRETQMKFVKSKN